MKTDKATAEFRTEFIMAALCTRGQAVFDEGKCWRLVLMGLAVKIIIKSA
jgi:hypothetical protein